MGKRIFILAMLLCVMSSGSYLNAASPKATRQYWVNTMLRIVTPVYENLANETLRKNMPVEVNDGSNTGKRADVSHLEALGRSFNGIAPWLNLGDDTSREGEQRRAMTQLVVKAITNAVNPSSPDYMPFDGPGTQPLVDAAFFAEGLLRSKDVIWPMLDSQTRQRIIDELKRSRKIRAWENNWLLFSATVEAALLQFTGECDFSKIKYALDRHNEWYKGDGWYGDGPAFHLDYYNSYVIQPMLVDVTAVVKENADKGEEYATYGAMYDKYVKRMARFAAQQEMLISPEGTFPMLGRSCGYRYGAFQALAHTSLLGTLPKGVSPAQVRSALTAVIKRQTVKSMFDAEGWLTLGFCGHQPDVAENYVSTGSAYLCCFVFLPLGLPADAEFWSGKDEKWSSQRVWSGEAVMRDAAIKY
ncbi:MAG: DUF2264 domain-containing protein [Alistipes sp.]|nr:DUF2264 domain-containing protein [Alistipes sp.]MBR2332204.1 DUF2264 domain-containing protein [Alistipes sp.]